VALARWTVWKVRSSEVNVQGAVAKLMASVMLKVWYVSSFSVSGWQAGAVAHVIGS
jgi:hypothetical protein